MFSKFMFIAGVGIVFAGAITVVKAVKEEQEEAVITISNEDGTFAREEHEEISFKEAAKRKVKKLYAKFILWGVDHIKDIQVWSACLGLLSAVFSLKSSIKSSMNCNKEMKMLNDIQNDLNSIKRISSRTWLMACDNNFTGNMLIESMCPDTYTTESTLIKAHDRTVNAMDMINNTITNNFGGVTCQTK